MEATQDTHTAHLVAPNPHNYRMTPNRHTPQLLNDHTLHRTRVGATLGRTEGAQQRERTGEWVIGREGGLSHERACASLARLAFRAPTPH